MVCHDGTSNYQRGITVGHEMLVDKICRMRRNDEMITADLDILFNDGCLLVLNKPEGLLIHRSTISHDKDTLADRLKELFPEYPVPAPVHRLDRPASGLVIAAFGTDAARNLSEQFTGRLIKKKYLAVTRGYAPDSGCIETPLSKDGIGEMQDACTYFTTLSRLELPVASRNFPSSRFSLVLLEPVTGRFHQLRRHMSRSGYPLIGDTSHGDTFHNQLMREALGMKRLYLHAWKVTLTHPESGVPADFMAPVQGEMADFIFRFPEAKDFLLM